MATDNPGARQDHEHVFETYVERVLFDLGALLLEIRDSMSDTESRLTADIDELASAIPTLATNLSDARQALADEKAAKEAEIAKEGQDQETITRLEGELAAINTQVERLDPIATEATGLVSGGSGSGEPAGGSGSEPAGSGDGNPPAPLPDEGGASGSGSAGGGAGSAGTGEGGV